MDAPCTERSRGATQAHGKEFSTKMQKRTHPLELKVESKDYTPAPPSGEKKTAAAPEIVPPVAEKKDTAPEIHTQPQPSAAEPKIAAAPAQETVTAAPAANPEIRAEAPAAAPEIRIETTVVAPAAPAAPAAEPSAAQNDTVPTPAAQEPPAAPKAPAALAPDRVAPVRPGRPAPPRPVRHNPAEDRVRHGENVADNDTSVAVKFRVAGDRVERRMVLARVSKDVCKLAQSLYPEQSLGSIIEGALLTRAFLQDRDAFDAMAREMIKKGGKIKC